MPTAKVTKNVSAAIGGGNVMCSTLISIKTKAWLYSFQKKYSESQYRHILGSSFIHKLTYKFDPKLLAEEPENMLRHFMHTV